MSLAAQHLTRAFLESTLPPQFVILLLSIERKRLISARSWISIVIRCSMPPRVSRMRL